MSDLPRRKSPRLKCFDYSLPGAYFITMCTKGKKQLLSKIVVGTGLPDCPRNILTQYGEITNKYINQLNNFYSNISVDKYVIMPNHIHLLIRVKDYGQSRMPVPTDDRVGRANSTVSKFVSTFKRFCNKEYGAKIWQRSYHDHIIRGEKDYLKIWEYIDNNILNWEKDCFYNKI